jgi:Holliday junction resolvase RusA-like endonuclease
MTDALFQATDTGVNIAPQRAVKDGHDADLCPPVAPAPVSAPVVVGVDVSWLCFDAYGTPAPQGSKRHVGRGVMVEASKRTRPWREAVKQAALDATRLHDRFTTAVEVRLTCYFDRPRTHYRTGRNAELLRDSAPPYPANRSSGDADKLARACLDAIVDGGVLADDSLVVDLTVAKRWAGEHDDALHIPGVRIEVRAAGR